MPKVRPIDPGEDGYVSENSRSNCIQIFECSRRFGARVVLSDATLPLQMWSCRPPMPNSKTLLCALVPLLLVGCAFAPSYRDTSVPITSMAMFDPEKYSGEWFEVASFPVVFQEGCSNTTATYVGLPDGKLAVLNECETPEGTEQIAGQAEVVGPGRLEVRLEGVPFAADYWVLWVDDSYETAAVGVPSGRAGWVLSREPDISPSRLQAAIDVFEFNGYDVERLEMTVQEPR